ncbi:GNAT family N-acetyltransferase [Cohnella sp. CFH 77786]|uniref:GNAT family N-acetyltransferase n=1 Tax=Cohnella sp. CFH 77786 TaxID=2662265 RepID=UPI001C611016|nr:GNAT family N-acetyltransferase [Cohnella sp. CFH 77786]MBW5448163.1 GNAT family N-acetyltransferase [Cohnella sp. CFH 77786]
MYKRLRVTDGSRMLPAVIRNYGYADFEGLIALQALSFPPPFPPELWWNAEQLTEHVTRFPEGALCAEIDGRIAGSMTALRVTLAEGERHDWASVTDHGFIRNHDPAGDTLYVVDICVAPEFRKFGLGKWLMQSMYETVVHLGASRLLGGGRMPGYHLVASEMSPEQYVEQVAGGFRKDPVLTFLLRCGRLPVGVAADYLEDEESCGYAALMEWRNPFKS